ncbi:hypothetical protein AB0M43_00515 [Longispora sp. NPDC051575]|uniref:hypothetical protein n=1 Tax=Longispora sp. NPDC051575 TaxID=3154943 RepID=UPI0034268AA8
MRTSTSSPAAGTPPAGSFGSGSTTPPGQLAGQLRDAVTAVPGVARCASAGPVAVTTQFRGGSVPGIRLAGDEVRIHVVLDAVPAGPIAEQVHRAAAAVLAEHGDTRTVLVHIADLELESLPDS